MAVYYETFCPDSLRFLQLLGENYDDIAAKIDLQLVPFGKAQITSHGVDCQHGPKECQGNAFHACLMSHPAININQTVDFVYCWSTKAFTWEGRPSELAHKCVNETIFGIDYDEEDRRNRINKILNKNQDSRDNGNSVEDRTRRRNEVNYADNESDKKRKDKKVDKKLEEKGKKIFDEISECSSGSKGVELIRRAGQATPRNIDYVPTVIFNRVYKSRDTSWALFADLPAMLDKLESRIKYRD